ncbi:MAG: arginine--tRNA ligase [Desulfobacteraceae bacterium 4572_130]|nr:MAG: arginine--tRNA ligase [Desulfobacteraceae bacterium 4572_130]
MKKLIKKIIILGAKKAFQKGLLKADIFPNMNIEQPRHDAHGDLSTNFAMISAGVQKMPPRKIAEIVISCINDSNGIIKKIEIAGPGFINFFLKDQAWYPFLKKIHDQNKNFGSLDYGKGEKVLIEFVSANPTGPLHVGHGRGAVVGDTVGNILAFAGFDVQKEYYINDSGQQIKTLGISVWIRFLQSLGHDIELPKDCYQGNYINDIALELNKKMGVELAKLITKNKAEVEKDKKDGILICAKYAAEKILKNIKHDLTCFGVKFNNWFSEQSMYDSGLVMETIEKFKKKNIIYEKDKAWWFKTKNLGDEKDRVVIKKNSLTTYFASDIAYHLEKFTRGFDRVIDVWGADHHGYIKRINACLDASGIKTNKFDVILIQLVNLLRDGEPVAMSTRAGEFVTLKNIIDEVGSDAARFIFLSRSFDSSLDFDLKVAKQKTNENPVYYVQYVHARIAGIMAKALSCGINSDVYSDSNLDVSSLKELEEIKLIKILTMFPEIIKKSAETLNPHVIFTYLMTLASAFHGYYNKHKVITEDKDLTLARLCLVFAVKKVIGNSLFLFGVSAPDSM